MNLIELIDKAFADDPEGAAVLVDEVIHNYALDILEADDALAQEIIADHVQHRINVAKASLGRQYVETVMAGDYPEQDISKAAEWLAGMDAYVAEVRKGMSIETWLFGNKKQQRRVARDDKGRFARIVDTNRSSSAVGAKRMSPAIRDTLVVNSEAGRAFAPGAQGQEERINRHQAQYEQADQHVRDFYRMFGGDTKDVVVQINRLRNGNEHTPLEFPLRNARTKDGVGIPAGILDDINPVDDTILSVTVAAGDDASDATRDRVARFNAAGLATGGFLGASSSWDAAFGRDPQQLQQTKATRLTNRMTALGDILEATGQDKAARFARLVGEFGPEAEKVFGPYIQQSAYRYRGTEKSPDKDLLEEFRSADMKSVRAIADGGQIPPGMIEELSARNPGVVIGSFARRFKDSGGDQLRLQVNSDVAAAHLVRTLPSDPFTAKLSEKSGHVLPSQGVVIDAEGRVISQAVGYADDHYLPFDLRNIAALRGGQYVRTRVAGGLTGEDIYASIQSGARMATVVSTSGVFSVEFDPNFRGARGNSDKARQMYERYLKILDAVDNSNLYLKDVSPRVHEEAEIYARTMTAGLPDDSDANDQRKNFRNQYLNDRRFEQKSGINVEELLVEAEQVAAQDRDWASLNAAGRARRVQDVYDELKLGAQEEGVQELALNAAGYDMALRTLQQQFPYFIRNVSYQPLSTGRMGKEGEGFLDSVGASPAARGLGSVLQSSSRVDRGYVEPGGLRPRKVKSGFYRVASPMEPKAKSGDGGSQERTGSQGGVVPASAGAGEQRAGGGAAAVVSPASTSAASTATPLQRRLGMYEKAFNNEANGAIVSLATQLQSIPVVARPTATMSLTWQEAKDSGNAASMAQWILFHSDQMNQVISDPAAVAALSDTKAVQSAVTSIWGAGMTDVLEGDESLREMLGGANNIKEVAQHVVNQVGFITDRMTLRDPFDAPQNDPMIPTAKPQAFPDLMGIDTIDKMKHFLSDARNAAVVQAGIDMRNDPGQYVRESLAALVAIRDNAQLAAAEAMSQDRDPDAMAGRLARLVGAKDTAQLADILGVSPAALGPSSWSPGRLAERARVLQTAWTLRKVQDILSIIDGDGSSGPKVPLPPEGGIAKSEAPSSPLGALRVLPVDHPLSVQVILSKAMARATTRS